MRNMEKTANKMLGKFNNQSGLDRYDMTSDELGKLIAMIEEGNIYEPLTMAFCYGFVLGHRATVAGKIKEAL